MNERDTLTEFPARVADEDNWERFEAWAELRGIDMNTAGAWEQFEREELD